jgi:hypothetical protein
MLMIDHVSHQTRTFCIMARMRPPTYSLLCMLTTAAGEGKAAHRNAEEVIPEEEPSTQSSSSSSDAMAVGAVSQAQVVAADMRVWLDHASEVFDSVNTLLSQQLPQPERAGSLVALGQDLAPHLGAPAAAMPLAVAAQLHLLQRSFSGSREDAEEPRSVVAGDDPLRQDSRNTSDGAVAAATAAALALERYPSFKFAQEWMLAQLHRETPRLPMHQQQQQQQQGLQAPVQAQRWPGHSEHLPIATVPAMKTAPTSTAPAFTSRPEQHQQQQQQQQQQMAIAPDVSRAVAAAEVSRGEVLSLLAAAELAASAMSAPLTPRARRLRAQLEAALERLDAANTVVKRCGEREAELRGRQIELATKVRCRGRERRGCKVCLRMLDLCA